MNILDLASISILLAYIIPPILFAATKNVIHLKAFIGLLATSVISESIKYNLIGEKSPRPFGATNCNLLCNDGNQAGRPGMPSSHSAEAAFILGYYFQVTNNKYIRLSLLFYAASIMLSRYLKKCHSIPQIVVGTILGLFLSWVVVKLE
jgi:membrane-associated phospholipid phosphatase